MSWSSGCHTVICMALVCGYQQYRCHFILECLIEKSKELSMSIIHSTLMSHAMHARHNFSLALFVSSLWIFADFAPDLTCVHCKDCSLEMLHKTLFRNWDQGANGHYRPVYAPMHQGLKFCFETKFLYFVVGGFSLEGWSLCEEYMTQSSEGTGNANLNLEVKLFWEQLRWQKKFSPLFCSCALFSSSLLIWSWKLGHWTLVLCTNG
jgi:hypothetical protein